MRRVAVTGLAVLSGAGVGTGAFREALRRGAPLGTRERVPLPRGAHREIQRVPLEGFDPAGWIPPGRRRKMSTEAQVVTVAFLMAARAAGIGERPVAPERTATYLGSSFGCMLTTAAYLRGIFSDGLAAASPLLFSESLANSPLGHAAINLDARGPSMGFAGGDAAFLPALGEAWRSIRSGRAGRALCGGYEQMSAEIIGLLARLSARTNEIPSLGDGAAVLVLEDLESARGAGARILAEMVSVGQAGDPEARPTDWAHDSRAWSAAHEAALRHLDPPRLRVAVRHAPPSSRARAAETRALERLARASGAFEIVDVHGVFGCHAAAGGLAAAAAVLACSEGGGAALVSAGAWGGSTAAAVMRAAEA